MIKRFKTAKQTGRAYRAPWYDSVRWRKARISYLQENPMCVECIKADKVSAAKVVDHIVNVSSVPQAKRYDTFWDESNWQGLCDRCHNSKSGKERVK